MKKLFLTFNLFTILFVAVFVVPLTSEYTTDEIQCNFQEFDGCYINVQNQIKNGDFSNGVENWTTYLDNTSIENIDGKLKMTTNIISYRFLMQYFEIQANHNYYVYVGEYQQSENVSQSVLKFHDRWDDVIYFLSTEDIQYNVKSVITPSLNGTYMNLRVFNDIGDYIIVDDIMVFDLTALGFDTQDEFESFMIGRGYMTLEKEWKMFIDDTGIQIRVPCEFFLVDEACPTFKDFGMKIVSVFQEPELIITMLLKSSKEIYLENDITNIIAEGLLGPIYTVYNRLFD